VHSTFDRIVDEALGGDALICTVGVKRERILVLVSHVWSKGATADDNKNKHNNNNNDHDEPSNLSRRAPDKMCDETYTRMYVHT